MMADKTEKRVRITLPRTERNPDGGTVVSPPELPPDTSAPRSGDKVPLDVWIVTRLWDVIRIPLTIDGIYSSFRMRWIPAGLSFYRAHRAGFVDRTIRAARKRKCASCPQRSGDWCRATQSSCGCPTSKRWLFSKLKWRQRLRSFNCPVGFWQGQYEPEPGTIWAWLDVILILSAATTLAAVGLWGWVRYGN